MANTYLTITMITWKMLSVLHNMMVAGKKANKDYKDQFAKEGAKIGATVNIRKTPLYTVSDGATFQAQDYTETFTPLTIDKHKQVGVEFLNDDLALNMDDFTNRVIIPRAIALANQVDVDILANYYQSWNATGVPGTIAATDTPFLDAKTLLLNNATPPNVGPWPQLVTPNVSARLSSGLAGRFNRPEAISELYDKGKMGNALGWEFNETQNMPTHTTGAWAANVPATGIQVNAANQTGPNIICKGASATVVGLGKKGDVVQFAGVFALNPITYLNTGQLANWVLTADVDSDGGGAFTLPIAGPGGNGIVLVGKQANASTAPAASAQVYVWGTATVANVASQTSPQCMGFAREGITLATVDLYIPGPSEGVKAERAADPDLGLSLLYMRGFDPRTFTLISRADILYGTTFPRPEFVSRTAS